MPTPLYALLIGINTYKAPFIPPLKGCRNDVELMASVLRSRFGVADEQLRVIVDEQATHAAIKQGIREHLISTAQNAKAAGQPIPAFLFHFSGHGSMARDASGAKATGLDETMVPHDSRQSDILDIKDWELGALIDELALYTDNITVVLDCCHSGSGTRDAELTTRQCPPDLRPQPERSPVIATGTRSAATDPSTPLNSHVLLAACSNSQSANEYVDSSSGEKRYYGAMSYALAEELAKTPAGNASYREIYQRVCRRLKQWYPLQSPQCEGDRDRVLFGGVRPPRDVWISVTGSQDGMIRIDAGGVHGLTEGDELNVFPEQQREIGSEARPLARLRVVQRDAVQSLCEVIDGERVLSPGCRIQPTTCGSQLTRTVSLAGVSLEDREAIQKRLTAPDLHGLVRVTADAVADLKVLSIGDGQSLCDAAGQPLESLATTQSLDILVASIRKWAKSLNALRIENPSPQSELRGLVAVEFKLKDGTQISDSNQAVLESGTVVQVQITNRSPGPLYVSALSFGYDGSVSLIWPAMAGEQLPLPPGKSVTTRAFRLMFQTGDARTQVREAIKVFATRSPTDFDLLTMDGAGQHAGTRSVTGSGPLGQLLEQAAQGSGTRLLQPVEPPAEEDWTTAELAYQLVRPAKELQRPLLGGQSVPLPGTACVVTAPAGFSGTLRPVTATPEQRSLGTTTMLESVGVIGHPAPHPQAALLASLLGGSGSALDSFEIDADNLARSQLSVESPLRVQWSPGQRSLESSVSRERVLAIASDGELLYPVGIADGTSGAIDVTWLPPAGESTLEGVGTRNLVRTVRLYFYKMLSWELGSLGLKVVRWIPCECVAAEPLVIGEHSRQFALGEVRSRRANPGDILPTHKVLVLVHGGLSDADSMLAEIGPLVERSGQTYDRIVAFEYETVVTPLQDSATQLAQALASSGITLAGGGRVDLLAVGTGTLVARTAIEMLGAHERVSRCLLAGPPNTGTLLAKSQSIARWLGTLALAKCVLVPQLLPLNMAFNKAVNDAAAIRDLQPQSDFLKALNAAKPPAQVPYTILAGVAALPPALAGFLRRMADASLSFLFDDEHDLVCSQTSMISLRNGQFPAEQLKVHVVPADHFTYWSEPITAERVVEWLKA